MICLSRYDCLTLTFCDTYSNSDERSNNRIHSTQNCVYWSQLVLRYVPIITLSFAPSSLLMESISFCPKCSKAFKRSKDLRYHLKQPCRIECEVCKITFGWKHTLKQHEKIYHEDKYKERLEKEAIIYICDICSRTYKRESDYHKHVKKHEEFKGFVCSSCDKTFALRHSLNKHLITHDISRWFRCELCPKIFSRKDSLKIHLAIHERDRTLQCKVCNLKFEGKGSLLHHLRTDHAAAPKIYRCDLCNKAFNNASTLCQHKKNHKERQQTLDCDKCTDSFESITALERHTKRDHLRQTVKKNKTQNENTLLKTPNSYEENLQFLNIDERVTREELDCDFCPYKCVGKYSLEKHMKKHRERIRRREELIKKNPLYKHLYFKV